MKKDKLWSLLRDIYGYFEMFVFAGCAVVACQSPSPYSDGLVLAGLTAEDGRSALITAFVVMVLPGLWDLGHIIYKKAGRRLRPGAKNNQSESGVHSPADLS